MSFSLGGATSSANATVLYSHTIGRYAFTRAGAVVTRDVPDHALVYGNPASVKGWMREYGTKLGLKRSRAICKSCKREYKKIKDKVVAHIFLDGNEV